MAVLNINTLNAAELYLTHNVFGPEVHELTQMDPKSYVILWSVI